MVEGVGVGVGVGGEVQTLRTLRDRAGPIEPASDSVERPYFTREQLLEFQASPMYQRLYGRRNPLYQTTNSQYGLKGPSEVSRATVWHGQSGKFTQVCVCVFMCVCVYIMMSPQSVSLSLF